MNITEARKQKVIFSTMYYATPPVFVGQADTKPDVSPAALKGKTIGTQSSTIHAAYLEKYYKDSEIKLYPTQDEPNLDIANGRLDYVVGDILVEQEFIDKKGNGCCKVLAEIKRDPAIHGPGVGAAFRPEDTELRDQFNKAIDELDADGTFKASRGQVLQERYSRKITRHDRHRSPVRAGWVVAAATARRRGDDRPGAGVRAGRVRRRVAAGLGAPGAIPRGAGGG